MISTNEILIRLSLAALFGALIGLERERKNWAAGLRTHMMVCVGSCLIMIVSAFGFADILASDHIALDPSRVAAQVVSGIGFIGAGTILFMKQGTIHGLTTAAGLWTVAGIGLATGGGMYFAAGAATVIALIILWALSPLERYFSKKYEKSTLKIVIHESESNTDVLKDLLNKENYRIETLSLEKVKDEFELQIKIDIGNGIRPENLINELKNNPAIKKITWVH
ncbi:MAG TPA: MgtC/SapB family protein [Niabella sp.]|jgi:putative Mg2+ transporter-C (MgtC) family protein|nr:MgtC/SapB family protein [Chitinophagaceae bacterium]HRN48329.1 MgtC/SapB family protein [Niabella sp.]HRO84529.1 MgtC/SapB family protein [Niabella sp.]HUN04318.1 MgtC/SapB family protein [Niabella sp.]